MTGPTHAVIESLLCSCLFLVAVNTYDFGRALIVVSLLTGKQVKNCHETREVDMSAPLTPLLAMRPIPKRNAECFLSAKPVRKISLPGNVI